MAINNLGTGLRPGVCTSTTRPTTPYEGQVIYETDTDLTYIYNGTAFYQVSGGTAVGNSGLVYVTSKTFTTTGSAQQIDNCFTSTYDNYVITYSGVGSTSGADFLYARVVDGTSAVSSAIYFHSIAFSGTGAMQTGFQANQTQWKIGLIGDTVALCTFTLSNPQVAVKTSGTSSYMVSATNDFLNGNNGQLILLTTQYEGINIFPGSGTFAGTITVFGYRKT